MFTDKKLLYLIFLAKYIIILTFNPDLENERFFQFFDSCRQICINPYENIDTLESGSLSFPYGYVMYLFCFHFFIFQNLRESHSQSLHIYLLKYTA